MPLITVPNGSYEASNSRKRASLLLISLFAIPKYLGCIYIIMVYTLSRQITELGKTGEKSSNIPSSPLKRTNRSWCGGKQDRQVAFPFPEGGCFWVWPAGGKA